MREFIGCQTNMAASLPPMAVVIRVGSLVCLLVLYLLLCLPGWGVTSNERILVLSPAQERCRLGRYLSILEDTTRKLTITEVASPRYGQRFTPARRDVVNFGLSSSAFWLRFTLVRRDGRAPAGVAPAYWLLDLDRVYLTSVKFYYPAATPVRDARQPRWLVAEAAGSRVLGAGYSPRLPLAFRLPGALEQPTTCYLRVSSDTGLYLPLEICSDRAYLQKARERMFWYGISYGVMLGMVLFTLFLGFSLNERSYLWFAVHVTCLALFLMQVNGLSFTYLFPGQPEWADNLLFPSLGAAMLGAGQFTRAFLLTKDHTPVMDNLLRGYMLLVVALLAVCPFIPRSLSNACFNLVGLLAPLLILATAVVCQRLGYRPARFFLPAWVVLSVGVIMYALTIRGVLPYSILTFYGFQISAALEAVLLSFALADRIRTLREEREALRRSEHRYMELSTTDALTGLYNSRYFRTKIHTEIQRAEAMRLPLCLLLLDADGFKTLNDTYGHQMGDRVLARLGEVMLSATRDNDLPCRYGGEEFAIILPLTPSSAAAMIAERLRAAIEAQSFPLPSGNILHVTASLGVAENIPGQKAAELIERADKALYQAKAAGRNRVIYAGDIPSAKQPIGM